MTISNDPVVIVSAARTPMGGFQGDFKGLTAPQLGAAAIRAAVERAGVADNGVEEVLFGCVLSAGLGQAPARQAALGAGLDKGTRCTTLNKMCGSGMEATILGHDRLLAGSADVVVAGAWRACPTRRICSTAPAAVTAWAMAGCWITCSSTALKTPTTVAA